MATVPSVGLPAPKQSWSIPRSLSLRRSKGRADQQRFLAFEDVRRHFGVGKLEARELLEIVLDLEGQPRGPRHAADGFERVVAASRRARRPSYSGPSIV